jgi:DNA-directed RNA polymerase subunit RPC12/RpoP
MPKYTYFCAACKHEQQLVTNINTTSVPCRECGKPTERRMPKLSGHQMNEVVNKLTGVKWKKDQEAMLKEMRDEHYWKNEVPRLVQKYSLQTCLENGWIYIDDKGQVQIRDKPPNKR